MCTQLQTAIARHRSKASLCWAFEVRVRLKASLSPREHQQDNQSPSVGAVGYPAVKLKPGISAIHFLTHARSHESSSRTAVTATVGIPFWTPAVSNEKSLPVDPRQCSCLLRRTLECFGSGCDARRRAAKLRINRRR